MTSHSEGLSELLRRVVAEYPEDQIGEGLTDHIARVAIENRIPQKIEGMLEDEDVLVKSSAGQGRWTAIPWVAIMDSRETTQIQQGIYVVYLFEPQLDRVTLTLNQGVTALKDELGSKAAREKLEETAREVRRAVHPEGFSTGPLEFPHASQRNKLYGPGTIYYKRYHLGDIPSDEELASDLRRLIDAYRNYISGKTSTEFKSTSSTDTSRLSEIDHYLAKHILGTKPTVYKFTAPPDYWLTAYEYTALGFEERDRDSWKAIQPGDVLLFHSTGTPGWEDLDNQDSGLIGAGIVRAKTTKPDDETWWYDERDGRPRENSFPYLVAFERLYATGDPDAIDFTNDIFAKSPATVNADLTVLTSDILPFSDVDDISEQVADTGFPRYQTIQSLDDDQANAIVAALTSNLREVSPVAIDKSFEGELDSGEILNGLYFPGSIGEDVITQIEGALRAGKHTILTGPPGTGKTEIAHRVGEYLAEEYPYLYSGSQVTTATADWSTFDTVGGYMPNEDGTDGDHLEFTPGLVLNRFKTRSTNVQRNESLVIDELNRADIDKAFGQLFTVLSGQPVQLPYTKHGKEVEIAPVEERSTSESHEYRIPDSWSLFATLNTYDKTSLYEMSYAFMRRFSFIRVPAPSLDTSDNADLRNLLENYTDVWNIEFTSISTPPNTDALLDVAQVWKAANGAIEDRAIGPAVVKDMLEFLVETQSIPWNKRLTKAVISYIFPQLEGVPRRERVVRNIASVDHIEERELDRASRDMLQVAATQNTDE